MIPSRWPRALWWLLLIPVFVMVVSGVEMLGRGGGLGFPVVALLSLAVVVPLDIGILWMRWRADARFDAVTALAPNGYVVEGLSCNPTSAALFRIGGTAASTNAGRGFVVVFDTDGARFYAGAREVSEFYRLRWSDVQAVSTQMVRVTNNRSTTALTLTVLQDGDSIVLPVVIKAAKGVTGFRFSSTTETLDRADAIRKLRGLPTAPPPDEVHPRKAGGDEPVERRELLHGLSSRELTWLGLIGCLVGLVGLLGMLPFGVLTWTGIWTVPSETFMPFLFVGLFAPVVGGVFVSFVPVRQSAETRAGYTFSRTGDINLDEVDCRSGYVIRPAGHDRLSSDDAKAARLRVRAEVAKRTLHRAAT